MKAAPSTPKNKIRVESERKANCVVKLSVELTPEFLQEEYEQALKDINKEVSLPGFRKGKAPRDYILSHFKNSVDSRWKDELAESAFRLAITETSLYPLDRNTRVQTNWKQCVLGESGKCEFEYETMPQVPEVDFNNLKIEAPEKACVCETEINQELNELAARNASWQEVDHKSPQEGDWVEVEALDESGNSIYIGKRFEFSSQTMPNDLYEAVKGIKIGEKRSAQLKKPGSDEQIDATLAIHKIHKRTPAAIDDNLAKHLGLADLAALKARIEKNLLDSSHYDYRTHCFDAIQKALGEAYSFDVPESTLGYELHMQENTLLSERGKNKEELSADELKSVQEEARKRAKAAICQTFLLHKIASQVKIQIEDKDIHELMRPFLHELEQERDQQKLRQRFHSLYNRCRMHLIAEKSLEHIASSRGWL